MSLTFAFPGLNKTFASTNVVSETSSVEASWLDELIEDLNDDVNAGTAAPNISARADMASSSDNNRVKTTRVGLGLPIDLMQRILTHLDSPIQLAIIETSCKCLRELGRSSPLLWRVHVRAYAPAASSFAVNPTQVIHGEEAARVAYRRRVMQHKLWSRWHEMWTGFDWLAVRLSEAAHLCSSGSSTPTAALESKTASVKNLLSKLARHDWLLLYESVAFLYSVQVLIII